MAWTAPLTWSTGYLATASDFNTHIRDNENYLYSTLPYICNQVIYNSTNRIPGTVYQNTTGKILAVEASIEVYILGSAVGWVVAYCSSTGSATTQVGAFELPNSGEAPTGMWGSVTFLAPKDFYYYVTGAPSPTLKSWVEITLF